MEWNRTTETELECNSMEMESPEWNAMKWNGIGGMECKMKWNGIKRTGMECK
jgi:hypothetical protein